MQIITNVHRLTNGVIDLVTGFIFYLTVTIPLMIFGLDKVSFPYQSYILWGLIFLAYWVYFIITEYFFNRTLGKLITKTKVVSVQDKKPSFRSIVVRTLIRTIPIEFVSFLFEKEGWHDKFSNTKVIKIEKAVSNDSSNLGNGIETFISITTKLIALFFLIQMGWALSSFVVDFVDEFGLGELNDFKNTYTRAEVTTWLKVFLQFISSIFILIRSKIGWALFQYLNISEFLQLVLLPNFYLEVAEIRLSSITIALVEIILLFIYFNWKPVRDYFKVSDSLIRKSYVYFPIIGTILYLIPITYYYAMESQTNMEGRYWYAGFLTAILAMIGIIYYLYGRVFKAHAERLEINELMNRVMKKIREGKEDTFNNDEV